MAAPITVRPARRDDGEAIADLHVAAARELGSAAYDPEQVAAWSAKKDPDAYPYDEDNRHFVVAERDGTVVGFGIIGVDEGEVAAVYVHPDYVRSGVGTALLEHLEDAARNYSLEWTTLLASKNAVGFYERHGYELLEWVEHESTDGVVLECAQMEKRLEQV